MRSPIEKILEESRRRTILVGVVNVTPDSFSDGGRYLDAGAAAAHGLALAEAGAEILDVGGESTRPGAEPVEAGEEWRRAGPVIEALVKAGAPPLSIDTTKAKVAERALDAGAALVNDVSGLAADPAMAPLVARRGCPAVLMHRRGDSRDMYAGARYGDAAEEVREELLERVAEARRAGVRDSQIILDPGLGFAKLAEHNLALVRDIKRITDLPYPVMAGPSRKRFIGEAVGRGVEEREAGTAAACALLVLGGVRLLRVHDPAAVRDAVRLAEAVRLGRVPG